MSERLSPEHERLLGLTILECAREIVDADSQIRAVQLREYSCSQNAISKISSGPVTFVDRDDFLMGNFVEQTVASLEPNLNLVLDSPVLLDTGEVKYLAMADVASQKSDIAPETVVERLREIVVPRFGGGFLLEAGKSYYYFGERTLTQDEWHEFLGRCLVASIASLILDRPDEHEMIHAYCYIGHSLIRGSTSLRISTNAGKEILPKVVALI